MDIAIAIWLVSVVGCTIIGAQKRATLTSMFLAILIGPLAIPFVVLSGGDTKECPECRKRVHPKAKKCPHCRSRFEDAAS